jgi:hypothetical protein
MNLSLFQENESLIGDGSDDKHPRFEPELQLTSFTDDADRVHGHETTARPVNRTPGDLRPNGLARPTVISTIHSLDVFCYPRVI